MNFQDTHVPLLLLISICVFCLVYATYDYKKYGIRKGKPNPTDLLELVALASTCCGVMGIMGIIFLFNPFILTTICALSPISGAVTALVIGLIPLVLGSIIYLKCLQKHIKTSGLGQQLPN
jgi:hypothetical protein